MRKIAVASAFLCLAGSLFAQPYQAWNRYREITVNTAAAGGGAGVAESVTSFPLLVRLTNAGGAAAGANVLTEALAGGADVRFTDSTGNTALSYQIENWSTTSAAVWVKVPVVSGNATTRIRMYWGRTGQTSASNGAAVFDTANGYTGVWHLNESGAGTVADATANGLNFTGHPQVLAVPGVAGNARYYNQGVGGGEEFYVDERPNHVRFQAAGASTAITISAWVNRRADGSSASQAVFGQFRYSAGGNRSYALMHQPSGEFSVLTSVQGTGDTRRVITSGSFAGNQWNHVVARINSAGPAPIITFHVNGVLQATTGTNTAGANAAVFTATSPDAMPLIGALERAFNQGLEAFIDEIQFSNGTLRDSNWIKLTYETQKPTATAVALGATQSVTARPLFYPVKHALYSLNAPIANNVPVVSGAASAWSITPTGLPAGLSFNTSTGVISGTPTAATAQTQFIVNATVGGSPAADTLTITVSAGDPPGAPTNVTAARGNAQAAVTWTAPLSSGTSAITGYTARAVQDNTKSCTWTTGPLTCTITGLTNGTAYTFEVRATSAAGNGPFSAASAAVTPATTPGAPTNVVVTQGPTATTGTVTWTAPAATGGVPVADYYATATPGGSICYSPGAAATPTCNITNLTVGTSYTVTVYASNGVGNGPQSAPSAPFVPGGTAILPGSFAIHLTGSSKPFSFALTPAAIASTDALTMSIMDMQGRTVWSKTVNPAKDGTSEVSWNGVSSTGRAVSAGVYMVRVATVNGGNTADFIRPAVSVK